MFRGPEPLSEKSAYADREQASACLVSHKMCAYAQRCARAHLKPYGILLFWNLHEQTFTCQKYNKKLPGR